MIVLKFPQSSEELFEYSEGFYCSMISKRLLLGTTGWSSRCIEECTASIRLETIVCISVTNTDYTNVWRFWNNRGLRYSERQEPSGVRIKLVNCSIHAQTDSKSEVDMRGWEDPVEVSGSFSGATEATGDNSNPIETGDREYKIQVCFLLGITAPQNSRGLWN